MKSIYKVILGMWISTLSFTALALDAPTALVPAGLNPGDQFYVMFKTTTKIRGDKSVVEYNNLVNADADANNIGPANGLTWSALMNHTDLNLSIETTTEQTVSLFAANESAPIYTTTGEQISINKAGLFDGAIDTAILNEADGQPGLNDTVWTGSFAVGDANLPLGNGADNNATEGVANAVSGSWIDDGSSGAKVNVGRIYAVSPLLDVPAAPATPTAPPATASDGGGAMDWSLLMLFSVLSLLRVKASK